MKAWAKTRTKVARISASGHDAMPFPNLEGKYAGRPYVTARRLLDYHESRGHPLAAAPRCSSAHLAGPSGRPGAGTPRAPGAARCSRSSVSVRRRRIFLTVFPQIADPGGHGRGRIPRMRLPCRPARAARRHRLGPLLRDTARVVEELCRPEQTYSCLWSHGPGVRKHLHFAVQPATAAVVARYDGLRSGQLQARMLAGGNEPSIRDVERFCGQARELFRLPRVRQLRPSASREQCVPQDPADGMLRRE
jgi:hypothetical protein